MSHEAAPPPPRPPQGGTPAAASQGALSCTPERREEWAEGGQPAAGCTGEPAVRKLKVLADQPLGVILHDAGQIPLVTDINTEEFHAMAKIALESCPPQDMPVRAWHIYTDGTYSGGLETAAFGQKLPSHG